MAPLKFLHLSDIHFQRKTVDSFFDLDKVLRAKIEEAVTEHVRLYGNLSGILISGDIAYEGATGDYEVADDWINTLSLIIGVNPLNTFMVPGNHDVDRSATKSGGLMDICHKDLRACDIHEIDSKIRDLIQRDEEAILVSLKNYNHFSTKYSCNTSAATGLTWKDDKTYRFRDGTRLTLHGINTAIISDQNDHAERGRLICSSFQSNVVPEKDEIYLVLAHHPPEWLRDGETLKRNLNDFAAIQLFGHKHEPSQSLIDNKALVIAAGAVHPERKEQQWIPSFNIIELDIVNKNDQRKLSAKVFKYRWTDEDKVFAPKAYGRDLYQENFLAIRAQPAKINPSEATFKGPMEKDSPKPSLDEVSPLRYLTYKYTLLALVHRIRIAADLDLVRDGDLPLNESFFSKVITRAQEIGKLRELWDAVASRDEEMQTVKNPF
jgi:predicted MPP superfamily phosphohydrolase